MQTITKTISGILATALIIGAGQHLLPNFKKSNEPLCSLKTEEIHISKHELIQNNKNSLKIKAKTKCLKRQVDTTIETDMFELINGHEHLVMPFEAVRKQSRTGSTIFYFKNILRDCLNYRPTVYVAHLTAHIKLEDERMITVIEKSKTSLPLKCSFY